MALAVSAQLLSSSSCLVKLPVSKGSNNQCLDKHLAISVNSRCVRVSTSFQASRRLRCQGSQQEQESTSSEGAPASPSGSGVNLNFIPPPENEEPGSFGEVMAFSGPAPEIVNGRLAMWGFLWGVIGELTAGTTLGQQFSSSPIGTIWTVSLLTVASFLPTLISDIPFGELLDTASDVGLPSQISMLNNRVEILHGRLAMIGFAGFMAIEAVTGTPTVVVLKNLVGI